MDNAIHLLKPGLRVVPYCFVRKRTVIEMLEHAQNNLTREEALLHAHACFSPRTRVNYTVYTVKSFTLPSRRLTSLTW